MQYDRRSEALFQEELPNYDVVVNCILWDVMRTDHILYRTDLARMKKNSMIIDVSCDRCGGIEASVPTTIENPTYEVGGILHYAVDHTPSPFYKTFTENNSQVILPYLVELMTEKIGGASCGVSTSKNRCLCLVWHTPKALERMHDCRFPGKLVISPEKMAPLIIHIFPCIGSQPAVDNLVCDVSVLRRMNPAENGLPLMQAFQIVSIPNFRETDSIAGFGGNVK